MCNNLTKDSNKLHQMHTLQVGITCKLFCSPAAAELAEQPFVRHTGTTMAVVIQAATMKDMTKIHAKRVVQNPEEAYPRVREFSLQFRMIDAAVG